MVLIFQKLLPKPNWAHLTMFSKRKQENKRRKSSQFVFVLQNYVAFLKTNERNVIYNGILNLCTHREILVLFDRSISTIWWFDNKITKIIERNIQTNISNGTKSPFSIIFFRLLHVYLDFINSKTIGKGIIGWYIYEEKLRWFPLEPC